MGHLSRSRVPSFYCCPLDGWSGNISLESGVSSGGGLVSKNRIGWGGHSISGKEGGPSMWTLVPGDEQSCISRKGADLRTTLAQKLLFFGCESGV